jgi:ATP-dependent RNA helicase DDX19/DBP5
VLTVDTAAPAQSLADRISSAEEPSEKKEEDKDKASATPTPQQKEDGNTKEQDTNLIQNKYEVAVKLQDLQADPNSPLFSVKSFEELGLYVPRPAARLTSRHPNLLKGIYGMKFQKPSKVQERALPLLVSNP